MGEKPHLYHHRVGRKAWMEAIAAFESKLKFIYAEEPAALYLADYRSPEATWPHGRAFGPKLEVRWSHRRDGQVDLLLLTESEPCPAGWSPLPVAEDDQPVEVDAIEDSTVMLVGMHCRYLDSAHYKAGTAHQWIETRIPRPLAYPLPDVPNPERWARLRVKVYYAAGRPVLTRMVDVEGTSHVKDL